ncbi:MAG: polysulfide reductase NrfD [Phycisphaerae bacterium]|nr:polysulfide reductase NrfD [Phycisphaerae bacterium]
MTRGDSILAPAPLIDGRLSPRQLDDDIYRPLESFPTFRWWIAISITGSLAGLFAFCLYFTVSRGIGMWGNNQPVGWAFDITNFVFWIGIGHAGTLISAILYVLRQTWRTSISRFSEAMTLFAVFIALQFPLFHTGRPWQAVFWLIPFPNDMSVYQNFRSPLEWDVFAVGTYGLVSLMFWYTGLLPDLATARDRARSSLARFLYGLASLGWSGSARAWRHYEKAYILFAGLATALVISVHSVVSFDFAVAVLHGWHSTIFPPYFVAGAIFSGFAMVASLVLILRKMFRLQHIVTLSHVELMNKIIIATSLMVAYAYAMEVFMSWYSGFGPEWFQTVTRATGPYAWAYWTTIACNIVAPQFLWLRRVRRSPWLTYPIVIAVNVGMWLERFVIIVVGLHRDSLPSSWGMFFPTWVDIGLLAGSFGVFLTLVLLFCRFLPTVASTELKAVTAER